MIAHRIETLKNCDFIIEMSEGQILSKITYDELRSRNMHKIDQKILKNF